MAKGPKIKVFFKNQTDKMLNVQQGIINRLKKRLEFQEVDSVDVCDVIITFVPVVSRAGTDIQAGLQNIPITPPRPVVLIVLHHTFDVDYVAPESRWSVNREDVLAVDFLGHEDMGLLTCLTNDKAMKSITDYLIPEEPDTLDHVGPRTPLLRNNSQGRRCWWICLAVFGLSVLCITLLLIFTLRSEEKVHTSTTHQPVTTHQPLTTHKPNITDFTKKLVPSQNPNTTVTTKLPENAAAEAA